jgi:acetyltransferase-like isoleucine patch superfamily enzyme
MLYEVKKKLRGNEKIRFLWMTFSNPLVGILGYLYGCYLTLRYVDTYNKFPAIIFQGGLVRLHIRKGRKSFFNIGDRLLVQPLGVTRVPCLIQVGRGGAINIHGEFSIGDDVRIAAYNSACIDIGGRAKESGSGISGSCLVNAYKKITIGKDVIIAWDTFITDSDWHLIEGEEHQLDTTIGDHVWVTMGVKILKGSSIGKDSIVACSSVVTSGVYPERSLIGGVPAKVIKKSIPMWKRDLHEIEG